MSPEFRAPIAIALGAIPGALSRYYLNLLFVDWFGVSFPYGTLFINVTGSFIMGLLIRGYLDGVLVNPELRLLFTVGFLGSYTTFSTYALDTSNLIRSNAFHLALLYWLGSAVVGVVGLELGNGIGRMIFR